MYLPKKEQFFTYEETTNGVIAVFDEVSQLIHAAEETRDKKFYVGFDCFSPFPIHGLDQAMGTPRSGIPWITFAMGLIGGTTGFMYQFLTNVIDWPINYSGKSYLAWPAFVPVTFEMTIFFAGIFSALTLFGLAKLKPGRKILHKDFTSHKFGLWIPATAPGYKEADTVNFLKSLGASEVKVVKE
jgi:hypothetical protein